MADDVDPVEEFLRRLEDGLDGVQTHDEHGYRLPGTDNLAALRVSIPAMLAVIRAHRRVMVMADELAKNKRVGHWIAAQLREHDAGALDALDSLIHKMRQEEEDEDVCEDNS